MDILRAVLEYAKRARSADSVPLSRIRNKNGQSPLHLAINRHEDVDTDGAHALLLEYGALVDVANNDGNTPSTWAIDTN